MYRVLYRKWRPATFSDVSGQPHVTKTLKNEVMQNKLAHAYLFVGSRGTGKTSCAKILAKAVNCLHPVDGDPCNECEICREINEGNVMDIVEIDAASNNGVDNIRELREEVSYTPTKGKYRVYIIDEVHMLSSGAFNALLKTLEEPPAHVIFILATTEINKLPATILSRCQRFDFRRIPIADIADRLMYVAGEENINLTRPAAELIAGLADGAMRDALSILDRVSAVGGEIDEQAVTDTVGLIGNDEIISLSGAIESGDAAKAVSIAADIYTLSGDSRRICEDLIKHYRNLMLIKATPKTARELIVCSEEEYGKLCGCADDVSLQNVIARINSLSEAMQRIVRSDSPRTELEVALITLACPTEVPGPIALPTEAKKPVAAAQIKPSPAVNMAEQETVPTPKPSEQSTGSVGEKPLVKWPLVIAKIKEKDELMYAIMESTRAFEQGNTLIVGYKNPAFEMVVKQPANAEVLKSAVSEITGKTYKFKMRNLNNEKKVAQNDPLDGLAKRIKQSGVPFTEEQ